jgi:hypothetical protein
MSPTNDNLDPLDATLRPHLARTLDAQRGRAGDAFAAALRRGAETTPASIRRPATRDRRFWAIGGAGGLVGAAAAAMLTIAMLGPIAPGEHAPATLGPPARQVGAADASPLRHAIRWRTVDDGTVYVNGDAPARSIRQQRLDQLEWFDPRLNARVEVSLPRDEVTLISLPSH